METNLLELAVPLRLEASNGGLFISRGVGRHPSRVINSFELILVKEGVLDIEEEGERFQVGPGETLILWPERRHGGTSDYPPELKFYWVHFKVHGKTQRSRAPQLSVPQHARIGRPDHLTNLFRRFLGDQELFGVQPLPASLMILLMLCEVTNSSSSAATGDSEAGLLAARADTLIRTRFHEALSASTIAAELGCNPDYLGRVFRSAFGCTLTQAIHARRLRHAVQLLVDGRESIDEVARQCGFEDSGYFRRLFKQAEGMTPIAFRRLHVRVHVNTS
jgi:AraC-like DNA-binding protein